MDSNSIKSQKRGDMIKKFHLIAITLFLVCQPCMANWTLNLGYRNPPGSQYGLNFLYIGSKFGFEIGLGSGSVTQDDANNDDKSDDNVTAALGGALSAKWYLSKGTFSPYLQLGFGSSTSVTAGEDTGANADLGGPFFGLGLLIGSPSFYLYGGLVLVENSNFLQAGIGFDI